MKNINYRLIVWLVILLAFVVRLWGINKVPVSLFGDELDVGYQAYSIIKTGKDYMGNSWPMHFRSLAEYRTPLYIYSAVPTVFVFGISPLGVRLPAMVFGFLGVIFTYLMVFEITKNKKLSLVALIIISLSSWQIQYSRTGFEVTLLYALFTLGLLTFLKSFKNPRYLILAMTSFGLTPWVYSTAKLYLPLTLIFLIVMWRKEIIKLPKNILIISSILFLFLSIPYGINTLKGGGVDRFNLISIFGDNSMEMIVGEDRRQDALFIPSFINEFQTRLLHNKYVFWGRAFYGNYLRAFSTDFLLVSGDGNARHNSTGAGVLYFIDFIGLLVGLYILLTKQIYSKKVRLFILFLLFSSPIPSALTIDGGNHATRLFLMIFPITVIVSIGIMGIYKGLRSKYKEGYVFLILIFYFINFYSYQHYYWNHYGIESEKMWNSGWENTIDEIISRSNDYDQIIISNYKDASLIYFLAWGKYPPEIFQKEVKNQRVDCRGFGKCSQFGKYLFPEIGSAIGLYEINQVVDRNELYVVPFEQVKFDLSKEPLRTPEGLEVVFTARYASGNPAYYAFRKIKNKRIPN